MSRDKQFRLRVLTLVVAFGIGLLSQLVAAVAMPMQMPMPAPHAKLGLTHAMTAANGCPSCPQRDMPGSPAMGPACALVFCSAVPAVLPLGPMLATPVRGRFLPVIVGREVGLTVLPTLGPPKPIHRT